MSYRKKLLIGFIWVVTLVLLFMSFFITKFLLRELKEASVENALQLSNSESQRVQMYFENMDMAIKRIATAEGIEDAIAGLADRKTILESERKIDEIFVQAVSFMDISEMNIYIYDASGNQKMKYNHGKADGGLHAIYKGEEKYGRNDIRKRILLCDNQNNDIYFGRDTISIGRCLYDPITAKINGYIEIETNREELEKLCDIGKSGNVLLLDNEDHILYPFEVVDEGILNEVRGMEDAAELKRPEIEMADCKDILDGQIKVITIYDINQIYSVFHSYEKISYVSILFIAAVAVVLVYISTNSLMKPLQTLCVELAGISDMDAQIDVGQTVYKDEFRMFSETFNSMMNKLKAAKDKEIMLIAKMERARYDALQAQISPHFMQNILYTMKIIIQDGNCDLAAVMCSALSKMMRYTVDMSFPTVKLKEELEYVHSYLELHSIIYEGDFTFRISTDAETEEIEIPKMTIQPFVENAVCHAFHKKRTPWKIDIACYGKEDIQIWIRDNGTGISEDKKQEIMKKISGTDKSMNNRESSIGIVNTVLRLQFFFKDRFHFEIEQMNPGTGILLQIRSR